MHNTVYCVNLNFMQGMTQSEMGYSDSDVQKLGAKMRYDYIRSFYTYYLPHKHNTWNITR